MKRNGILARLAALLLVALSASALFAAFSLSAGAAFSELAGGTTMFSLDFSEQKIEFDPASKSGSAPGGVHVGSNIKYGSLRTLTEENGNDYYQFFTDKTNCGTEKLDPFGGFYISGRNNSKEDGKLASYDYLTLDFDMSSFIEFIEGMNFFWCARNATGGLATGNTKMFYPARQSDGTYSILDASKKEVVHYSALGEWHHFTLVLKVDQKDYTKSVCNLYVDGKFKTQCSNLFTAAAVYIDTFRWGVPTSRIFDNNDLALDNATLRSFPVGYTGAVSSLFTQSGGTYPDLFGNTDGFYGPAAAIGTDYYFTVAEALENMSLDKTFRLLYPQTETVKITKEGFYEIGAFAFPYETELNVYEQTDGEGNKTLLFRKAPAVCDVVFEYEGKTKTETVAWGKVPEIPADFRTLFEDDGNKITFVGWQIGSEILSAIDLPIAYDELEAGRTYRAVYLTEKIYYVVSSGGAVEYGTDKNGFSQALRAFDGDVSVSLRDDLSAPGGVYLPSDKRVDLDLSGYSLTAGEGVPAFILPNGAALVLKNTGAPVSISSTAPAFYLFGSALLDADLAGITVSAPALLDGVYSASTVIFRGGAVALTGEPESVHTAEICADGASITLEDVSFPTRAARLRERDNPAVELKNCTAKDGAEAILRFDPFEKTPIPPKPTPPSEPTVIDPTNPLEVLRPRDEDGFLLLPFFRRTAMI